MRPSFVAFTVAALLSACGGSSLPKVALTIDTDSSVSADQLARVTTLKLRATGDETYSTTTALPRALARVERLVYVASASTRNVTLEIDASDASGAIVASGTTSSLSVSSGHTTNETITLYAPTVAPDLSAVNDLSVTDLESPPDFSASYAEVVLADSPLAYYHLDESQGPVAADSSGHTNNAQYQGTCTFGLAGVYGDSFRTDSQDAWVRTNNQGPFAFTGNQPWTVEIWMYPPTIDGNFHQIVSYDLTDANGRQDYGVFADSNDGLVVERYINDAGVNCAAPLPTANVWSHIVGSYDGTNLSLYVNGTLACQAIDKRAAVGGLDYLYFGGGGPGWLSMAARYDEAAVYATALSAARIKAHYDAAQ